MNSSKWIGGFFSMVFAIGLVVGTQAHADFVTHKSTLILELGATTKGVLLHLSRQYARLRTPADVAKRVQFRRRGAVREIERAKVPRRASRRRGVPSRKDAWTSL